MPYGPWALLDFHAGVVLGAGANFEDETIERVDEFRWRQVLSSTLKQRKAIAIAM